MGSYLQRLISYILIYFFSIHSTYAELKIGTEFYYPPYVISSVAGFDILLMNTICRGLKEKCVFVHMKFNALFTALQKEQVDLIISGISITSERADNYAVSLPYMLTKAQFLVLANSGYKKIDELNGRRVGVVGGIFYDYLFENYGDKFKITSYDSMNDLINDLNKGRVAAVFVDAATVAYWLRTVNDQFRIISRPVNIGQGLAIMALPKNAVLIRRINQQIEIMEANGTYLKLFNTYFAQ